MAAFTSFLIAAGVGLAAGGAYMQYEASKDAKNAQQQILQQQQQQEALRQKQMELEARRRTLQQIRQAHVARATALTAATNQGAGFGSGLQGGYGQISGQANTNLLGINQNLELGRQNFSLNAGITQSRMDLSNAQSSAALGSSLSSLGGQLVTNASTIGNITKGWGGSSFDSNGMGLRYNTGSTLY